MKYIMSSVYYPFFFVEKSIHKHYNHQKNIILLTLFSKDVLIPIRHFLLIGEDEFDILMKYENLIKQGVLYYRLPIGTNTIDEYYDSIKSSIKGIPAKTINYRIKKLNEISNQQISVYDPSMQQSYYSERMKDFLRNFVKGHNKLRVNCRDELIKIADEDIVTKELFDHAIKNLKDTNILSETIYKKLINASNVLYFCAGSSGSKLKVCKDNFFDISGIDECMLNTIHNYDEIINESYNPNSIEKVLIEIGVIESSDDLYKLTCKDIIELRSTKWHEKFVAKYCRLSNTKRALGYLKEKKKLIGSLKKLKGIIFSLFLSVITAIISYFLVKTFLANMIVTVVTFVISEILITIMQKLNLRFRIIDDLLDKLLGIFIPDVLFLYKIYEKVSRA